MSADAIAPRPRQLIVLCDGTNNSVDAAGLGTNVLQLARCFNLQDTQQKVFYDPGVGSAANAPGATWADKFKQRVERIKGLAFGDGVFDNIAQAYAFLMREYQLGDEIYIFGFSRGAFTARGVAGMVNQFGLLPPHADNLLPLLLNIYFASNKGRDEEEVKHPQRNGKKLKMSDKEKRAEAAARIKEISVPLERSNVLVHFVGVWDTVATIGIPPLDKQFSVVASIVDWNETRQRWHHKNISHVRQALALDEHRAMFKPRPYVNCNFQSNNPQQSLVQHWFAGAHVDVGGTYPDNPAISHASLHWICSEACSKGLRISKPVTPKILPAHPVVHSEIYNNPWWAAGGMCVRQPLPNDPAHEIPPQCRQIVSMAPPLIKPLRYPQDTVWSRDSTMNTYRSPRRWWTLAIAALVCAVLMAAMGWAVADLGRADLWRASSWCGALHANKLMALWQLNAVFGSANPIHLTETAKLSTALLLDFAFIAAYAYLLGRLCSRAFAAIAGLTTVHSRAPRALNILGMGLLVLVVADLLENTSHLLYLATQNQVWPIITAGLALAITLASLAKWTGLGMCCALMLWGAVKRR
jgi:uncharacterized protein (DUF2235 family)